MLYWSEQIKRNQHSAPSFDRIHTCRDSESADFLKRGGFPAYAVKVEAGKAVANCQLDLLNERKNVKRDLKKVLIRTKYVRNIHNLPLGSLLRGNSVRYTEVYLERAIETGQSWQHFCLGKEMRAANGIMITRNHMKAVQCCLQDMQVSLKGASAKLTKFGSTGKGFADVLPVSTRFAKALLSFLAIALPVALIGAALMQVQPLAPGSNPIQIPALYIDSTAIFSIEAMVCLLPAAIGIGIAMLLKGPNGMAIFPKTRNSRLKCESLERNEGEIEGLDSGIKGIGVRFGNVADPAGDLNAEIEVRNQKVHGESNIKVRDENHELETGIKAAARQAGVNAMERIHQFDRSTGKVIRLPTGTGSGHIPILPNQSANNEGTMAASA